MNTEQKIKTGFLTAFLLMLVTAFVPFQTTSREHALRETLRQSETRIIHLLRLVSLATDAETGQRGFIIAGQERFLDPYHAARLQLGEVRKELRQSYASSDALPQIDALERMLELKLADMASNIDMRRTEGFAATAAVVANAKGKQYMDDLRLAASALIDAENVRNAQLHHDTEQQGSIAAYSGLATTILNILLLAVAVHFVFRLLREQQRAATELRETGEHLNAGMTELERRNTEILVLAQMARALESAVSTNESLEIIALYCARLLPDTAGELLLYRNSRDALEKGAQWGQMQAPVHMMEPGDCWALRRGQPHKTEHAGDLGCEHYRHAAFVPHLCLPLTAQGDVLGLICLEPARSGDGHTQPFVDRQERLMHAVAEQVSLALANARLREMLKQQSIVDPLTGLFNRRYMDETLRRELSRAVRKSIPLSFVLLDVDHFKKINDSFGHEAGDAVLRSIARHLRASVREADLVCRFGGEELVLIMPECDKQDAVDRVERIRVGLTALDVISTEQRVGPVSASFGVATFPQDGDDADALVKAADRAMYAAKKNGRNRVETAPVVF